MHAICHKIYSLVYISCFFFSIANVAAQKAEKPEGENLDSLIEQVSQLMNNRKSAEASKIIEVGLGKSYELSDTAMMIRFSVAKAGTFVMTGSIDSAIHYYKKGFALFKADTLANGLSVYKSSYKAAGTGLIMMSEMYSRNGKYKNAKIIQLQALDMTKEMKDTFMIMKVITNMANLEQVLGRNDIASAYKKQALELANQTKSEQAIKQAMYSLAVHYHRIKEIDSAVHFYNKALAMAHPEADEVLLSYIYNNLGLIASTSNSKKALEYYGKSLEIKNKVDIRGAATTYLNMARIYRDRKQSLKALQYTNKALEVSKQYKRPLTALHAYQLSAELYEDKKAYKQALEARKSYELLNDSLTKQEHITGMAEVQAKYESSQKDKEITLLETEKELESVKAERQKLKAKQRLYLLYFLIVFVVAVVITATILYKGYRKNKRINTELTEAGYEKERLVKIASHDLKAPFNEVKGLISHIKKEPLNGEQSKYINLADSCLENGLKLINRLLDVRTLEEGNVAIQLSDIEVGSILTEVIEANRNKASAKRINIYSDGAEEVVYAQANCMYLRHIIQNLLSNAIKFSNPGDSIAARLYVRNERAEISITDHGPGISEKDVSRLFGQFQKLSARPTAGESSSGLGLFIVKSYTEALKGKVWCHSIEGQGATFYVSLPLVSHIQHQQENLYANR